MDTPVQPQAAEAEEETRARPGVLRRILAPFHVTGIFWVRLIVWASRRGDWFLRPMTAVWSCVFSVVLPRMRRIITKNLEGPLGPCGFFERQRRIFRSMHMHAWVLVERFEQFRPKLELDVEFVGDVWQEFSNAESGMLLFTAHLSNWEIAPLMPRLRGHKPVHVVREKEMHPATQRYLEQLLENHPRSGCVTHFLDREPHLGTKLLLHLRRGEIVTLSGDRPRQGMDALEIEMFGRKTDVPLGTIALARAAEVPVIPVFVFRDGRRKYRVIGRDSFRIPRTDDRRRDLQDGARMVGEALEWAIAEKPYQWFRSELVWK